MEDVNIEEVCKAIITIAGGAGAVALTPAVLAAIGFTSTGIAASSLAAKLMAYFAVANGGGVAAGGLVAILQSLGTGMSWFGFGAVGGFGSTIGWVLSTWEPENPITIAISSNIFQDPVISFVKALKMVNDALRQNYPESKELFRVLLTSDNLPDSLMTTISENELDDLIIPLPVGGRDFIGELRENNTLLYLSAEKSKAGEALNNGIAAAAVFIPETMEGVSETQLRVAFDGDAVLFSNESELFFKDGLEAFLKHEKDNVDNPMNEGPLKGFLEVLQRLQRKLRDKKIEGIFPIRTYLVTSRGTGCAGYRALNTLCTWDLETDEAVFLCGTEKGPTLEKIRPHIFFDDRMNHINAALAVGTFACLVPDHA